MERIVAKVSCEDHRNRCSKNSVRSSALREKSNKHKLASRYRRMDDRLDIGRVHLDRGRLPDEIDRENQANHPFAADKGAFGPFERAAYDAHPPASTRIRMRLSPEPRSHHIPQGLNLLIRKRARQTSETHDAGHARNLEHAQTFFYRNPHEDVACEQRNLEPPSAVCP